MKPKTSKYKNRCPQALSSQCIEWNGPSIPCLDICHDDVLTDVVHAIGTKVCELVDNIDMSELDLECLIGLPNVQQNYSLKMILQLLLDNDCKLQDLIDAAGSGGSNFNVSNPTLNLNYQCIEKFDAFDNPIPQNLNETLQSLIDQVCDNVDNIEDHETRITFIENNFCPTCPDPDPYQEPIINIPTSDTPEILSQAVIHLGEAYGEHVELVGSNGNILTAMSRQCANLNPIYGLVPGWISNPLTLADTINNLWIVACDSRSKVQTIQETCCSNTCDSILLGFSVTVNIEDSNDYHIVFNNVTGTFIPPSFTDNGSTITFTDVDNNVVTDAIVLSNSVSEYYDLSTLNLTAPITIEIDGNFISNDLQPQECSKAILINYNPNSEETLCTIQTSGNGNLIITYVLPTNPEQLIELTIPAGTDGVIPKNAIIYNVESTETTSYTPTNCISLTNPGQKCYLFTWQVAKAVSTDLVDPTYNRQFAQGIMIGNTMYNFNGNAELVMAYASDYDAGELAGVMFSSNVNTNINTPGYYFTGICPTATSVTAPGYETHTMKLSVPATLATAPEMVIRVDNGQAPDTFLYIKGVISPNCNC